jgi:lipopolysaccharide biosynthesis regulator YciM
MRRKGEVERAIRIHQNLLARPSLPATDIHQAHLELARDYIAAGLLDRAERLLEDLIKEAPELRSVAMRHLLEIYQDEKEWQQAITTAQLLLPKKSLLKPSYQEDQSLLITLAHYYCELAEQSLSRKDYLAARQNLKRALATDKACVRASLLMADAEFGAGQYGHAIRALRRIRQQDPSFVPESMPMLKRCYLALGDSTGYQSYLYECLEQSPSAAIVLAVADDIAEYDGAAAAASFVAEQLQRRPSLRGLQKMIELNVAASGSGEQGVLVALQQLVEQLMANKPFYRCQQCGFAGRQIHWLCPSCKQWGQVKSIRGAEGD